jgi:hypothetical protein
MPDDTTPGESVDPPGPADPGATPPVGTPAVSGPDGDATGGAAAPGAAAGSADESEVAAVPGGGADETSVVGATAGTTDATSVLAATAGGATEASAADNAAGADGGDDGGPRHSRRRSMSRAWIIAIVAAVVVLAGAGIALAVTSGTKKANATKPRQTAAAPIITVPSGPLCPLTGQPAPGGHVPARPALAIKVDNYPTARPQSGLDKADVVFEEPVEGGITRFVAVFQCQEASLVGPIRSARAVDVPILDQLSRPLFVHAGGINPVIALVEQGNLINDDVFTHASIIQHPAGRYAPYDTYTSTAAAWALDPTDTTPPAPLYTYSSATPAGTAVASVHIPFSGTNDNTWTWSPITGQWLLSIGGAPANMADGGKQLGVANIVVQSVHVTYGPWAENSEGGLEVQSQLVGSGPLDVFRNGVEISGTWERAALSDTTSLVAADGSTIALDPGETWVELVPSTIPVTTTAASAGGTP